MPQASESEHEWALKEFGNIDDATIAGWLKKEGYELTDAWVWIKPNRLISNKERGAINFLMDEWDYGGVNG